MGANKSKLSAKGPPLCNTGGIITTYPDGGERHYTETFTKHTSGKACKQTTFSSSGGT
jgi:hypothetical protein